MSRRTATYGAATGRDENKVFLITEMSAAKAEEWAMRVLLALVGANVNVPENFEELGMAGLAELGMRCLGNLSWDVAKPLLDEMLACVQILPSGLQKAHIVRGLIESDIEEVSTRLALRVEVWKLHMDFLEAVAPSFFKQKATAVNAPKPRIKTSAR